MSKLRPETVSTKDAAIYGCDAYFAIYNAVCQQPGLYHGKLDGPYGEHCAIGSYFALPKHKALPSELIEEVAAINDSFGPSVDGKKRKREVLRWLRWKLSTFGLKVPGQQQPTTR